MTAEQVPPVDLDAMQIDQRLAANRRPANIPAAARAADRVIHTHLPALLAEVARQDRYIADLEIDAAHRNAEAPLYPPRVEWVVQVHEPDGWDTEADGWEQIGPPYPTREDAHDRADRRRACRDAPQVRVVTVQRTYTLDATRAPESPAHATTPRATPDA